jgi:hypothetical protein
MPVRRPLYLWKNAVAKDLGVLRGDCSSEGKAISFRRQVVAVSVSCDGSNWRAFLWEDGVSRGPEYANPC